MRLIRQTASTAGTRPPLLILLRPPTVNFRRYARHTMFLESSISVIVVTESRGFQGRSPENSATENRAVRSASAFRDFPTDQSSVVMSITLGCGSRHRS